METYSYKTVKEAVTSEYREKGSKFLGYAQAVIDLEEAKFFVDEIKEMHPKATHHCYAYRLGFEKDKNYRANDDGEPSGTAGRPILGQIDSHGLTNVMVIVVRYYGGTKLGVPGLIRSYKTTAKEALANAEIVEHILKNKYLLRFEYPLMNEVMRKVKRNKVKILNQGYTDKCEMNISMAKQGSEAIISDLQKLRMLEIKPLID
ncbi:MAG: IMPACT family protein [Chitinophagales bacterium]